MYNEFYKNGIAEIDFKSKTLNKVLLEIFEGNVKDDFNLSSKYRATYDLRPNVYDYDSVFLNVLKENNIKSVIHNHTLKDKTAKEVAEWNALVTRQLEPFKELEMSVLASKAYCGWVKNFKNISLPLEGLKMGFRNRWLIQTLNNHNQKTLWEKNTK